MPKFTAIPMQPCRSSQIQAFGYDADTKTLAIRFAGNKTNPDGTVYTYSNVPADVYAEFEAAESKGQFFGQRIKGNAHRFPFIKIDESDEQEKTS